MKSWKKTILINNKTVMDAINSLNKSLMKIVIVIDKKKRFVGTITDGDIRRYISKNNDLNSNVMSITQSKSKTIKKFSNMKEILNLMRLYKIQHLPQLDKKGRVINLFNIENFIKREKLPNEFVVMAGGKGKRMGTLTKKNPKPMLKVKGKPILQHILNRAVNQGFENFTISVNYKKRKIRSFFEDGKKQNIKIKYIDENKPLGTAGSLSNLKKINESFVVINGDIITDINFGELIKFHETNKADATMCIRLHVYKNPFGVVVNKGIKFSGIFEKPLNQTFINAGVYAMNPKILKLIKKNAKMDMPDLFELLTRYKKRVMVYVIHEKWIEIGNPKELKIANKIISN